MTRAERDRLARRRELIDAATVVFAVNGFEKATLSDVAQRAGFGTGTIYNYFPNKEHLFECVIEEAFAEMKRIAEETLAEDAPFDERLRRLVDRELRYFFAYPVRLRILLRESHQLRNLNPMLHLMPTLVGTISTAIAEEQSQGALIDDCDPTDLSTALLNLLFGQFSSRVYKQTVWRKWEAMELEVKEREETTIEHTPHPFEAETIEPLVARISHVVLTIFLSGIQRPRTGRQ